METGSVLSNGGAIPHSRLPNPSVVCELLDLCVQIPTAAVAAKGNAAIAMGTSLVPATDLWSLWTLLLICSALGLRAEKTKVILIHGEIQALSDRLLVCCVCHVLKSVSFPLQLGAALSSPLVTMLLSLVSFSHQALK